MLKAIEKLLNGTATKVGNHRAVRTAIGVYYYYHNTAVCVATYDCTVKFDNGGWGTSSTTRAINDYRKHFVDRLGFEEVSEIKDYTL